MYLFIKFGRKVNLYHNLDCNDQKVHESLVVSSKATEAISKATEAIEAATVGVSRKNASYNRMDARNSYETYTTEVSQMNSSFIELDNFSSPRSDSPETRPVERAIEARSGSEDGLGSMVRCLHFAETFIANRKSYLLERPSIFRIIDLGSLRAISAYSKIFVLYKYIKIL